MTKLNTKESLVEDLTIFHPKGDLLLPKKLLEVIKLLKNLPDDQKKFLTSTLNLTNEKYSFLSNYFNSKNLISIYNSSHKKQGDIEFKNLFEVDKLLGFVFHQVEKIDKYYDVEEIKNFYLEYFKFLSGKQEIDTTINAIRLILEEFNKVLEFSKTLKEELVTNKDYEKFFILNNIVLIKKELIKDLNPNFIKHQLLLIIQNGSYTNFNKPGVFSSHLIFNEEFIDMPKDFLKKSNKKPSKSFNPKERYVTSSKEKITINFKFNDLKEKLKNLFNLNYYCLQPEFFQNKELTDLNYLLSSLFNNLFNKDLKYSIDTSNALIIITECHNRTSRFVSYLQNVLGNVKVKKEIKLEYNINTHLPQITFKNPNVTLETFLDEKAELNESENIKNLIRQFYKKHASVVHLSSNFSDKIDCISVPIINLNLGSFEIINKIFKDYLTATISEEIHSEIKSRIHLIAEIIPNFDKTEKNMLVKITISDLYKIVKVLENYGGYLPEDYSDLMSVKHYINDLMEEKRVYSIYAIFIGDGSNIQIPGIHKSYLNHTSGGTYFDNYTVKLKMRQPVESVRLFGNKSKKYEIFNLLQNSLNIDREYTLRNLFQHVSIDSENNYSSKYESQNLKNKGCLNPVEIVTLNYNGEKLKFLLSDFYIEYSKNLDFKIKLESKSIKKPVKKLIPLKTIFTPLKKVINKYDKTDPLLFIEEVNNLLITYNSGNNKGNKFVKVKNLNTNQTLIVNKNNLKINEQESNKKKSSKK